MVQKKKDTLVELCIMLVETKRHFKHNVVYKLLKLVLKKKISGWSLKILLFLEMDGNSSRLYTCLYEKNQRMLTMLPVSKNRCNIKNHNFSKSSQMKSNFVSKFQSSKRSRTLQFMTFPFTIIYGPKIYFKLLGFEIYFLKFANDLCLRHDLTKVIVLDDI